VYVFRLLAQIRHSSISKFFFFSKISLIIEIYGNIFKLLFDVHDRICQYFNKLKLKLNMCNDNEDIKKEFCESIKNYKIWCPDSSSNCKMEKLSFSILEDQYKIYKTFTKGFDKDIKCISNYDDIKQAISNNKNINGIYQAMKYLSDPKSTSSKKLDLNTYELKFGKLEFEKKIDLSYNN